MNIHYQAIAPDGTLRGPEQLVSTTNNNAAVALACRVSQPTLDLEFEEQATSASYADSSQYGHDATCNLGSGACPIGGVEGALATAFCLMEPTTSYPALLPSRWTISRSSSG